MIDCNMEFTSLHQPSFQQLTPVLVLDVPALRARNEATANTESQSITDGGLDRRRESSNVH